MPVVEMESWVVPSEISWFVCDDPQTEDATTLYGDGKERESAIVLTDVNETALGTRFFVTYNAGKQVSALVDYYVRYRYRPSVCDSANPPATYTGEDYDTWTDFAANETFTGNGTSTNFTLERLPNGRSITVTVNGVATTAYVLDDYTIRFGTPPSSGAAIAVGFTTNQGTWTSLARETGEDYDRTQYVSSDSAKRWLNQSFNFFNADFEADGEWEDYDLIEYTFRIAAYNKGTQKRSAYAEAKLYIGMPLWISGGAANLTLRNLEQRLQLNFNTAYERYWRMLFDGSYKAGNTDKFYKDFSTTYSGNYPTTGDYDSYSTVNPSNFPTYKVSGQKHVAWKDRGYRTRDMLDYGYALDVEELAGKFYPSSMAHHDADNNPNGIKLPIVDAPENWQNEYEQIFGTDNLTIRALHTPKPVVDGQEVDITAVSMTYSYDDPLRGNISDTVKLSKGERSYYYTLKAAPYDIPIDCTFYFVGDIDGEKITNYEEHSFEANSGGAFTFTSADKAEIIRIYFDGEPEYSYSGEVETIKLAGRNAPISRYGIGGTRSINLRGVAINNKHQFANCDNKTWRKDLENLATSKHDWFYRAPGGIRYRVAITSVDISESIKQIDEVLNISISMIEVVS